AACAAEEKRREEKRREEKRREEKRREEKRREEKRREERRFFAGWIHFRLLIRFNRLKKKIFTDVERRIISGSGRCFNTIWRMNKNRYGLPRPGSKGTVP
ncbi:TPA: hypothetical protein ACJYJ0_001609, partial [Neisseria gonorrhoeae]